MPRVLPEELRVHCHMLIAECCCEMVRAEQDKHKSIRDAKRNGAAARKVADGSANDKEKRQAKLMETRRAMLRVDRQLCKIQKKCAHYHVGVCDYCDECKQGAHEMVVREPID